MNSHEFERHFLSLVFQTSARLTPAFVAYRLGLPVAETRAHLEELLQQGIVELDSDGEGRLFYVVPGAERPSEDLAAALPAPPPAARKVSSPAASQIGAALALIFLVGVFGRLLLLILFLLGGGPILICAALVALGIGASRLCRAVLQEEPATEATTGPSEW